MPKKLLALSIAAALAGVVLAGTAAGRSQSSQAPQHGLSCPGQSFEKPFVPWLDPANYVLLPNGSLESSSGWMQSSGAKLVAGNEPFHVHAGTDGSSLLLPPGSSATSPPLCITLLHPDLRFFAVNTGSALSLLEVDAIVKLAGLKLTLPVGLVIGGSSWQPTLPMPFLTNLLAPLSGTVSFRFTPLGKGGRWQIDDVYVDPYKSS